MQKIEEEDDAKQPYIGLVLGTPQVHRACAATPAAGSVEVPHVCPRDAHVRIVSMMRKGIEWVAEKYASESIGDWPDVAGPRREVIALLRDGFATSRVPRGRDQLIYIYGVAFEELTRRKWDSSCPEFEFLRASLVSAASRAQLVAVHEGDPPLQLVRYNMPRKHSAETMTRLEAASVAERLRLSRSTPPRRPLKPSRSLKADTFTDDPDEKRV